MADLRFRESLISAQGSRKAASFLVTRNRSGFFDQVKSRFVLSHEKSKRLSLFSSANQVEELRESLLMLAEGYEVMVINRSGQEIAEIIQLQANLRAAERRLLKVADDFAILCEVPVERGVGLEDRAGNLRLS